MGGQGDFMDVPWAQSHDQTVGSGQRKNRMRGLRSDGSLRFADYVLRFMPRFTSVPKTVNNSIVSMTAGWR